MIYEDNCHRLCALGRKWPLSSNSGISNNTIKKPRVFNDSYSLANSSIRTEPTNPLHFMEATFLLLNYPSLKGVSICLDRKSYFTDNRLEHEFLGFTSSPRASHPVVPTVGRFLFRQIQYTTIFFKGNTFYSRRRACLDLLRPQIVLSLKGEVLRPHWIKMIYD